MESPGPYCQALGISYDLLENKDKTFCVTLSNGAVLEIVQYTKERNINNNELVNLLASFDQNFSESKTQSVVSKIQRLTENKSKLRHKKKVKGVKNLSELLAQPFTAIKVTQRPLTLNSESVLVKESETIVQVQSAPTDKCRNTSTNSVECQTEDLEQSECSSENVTKRWNMKKYLCNKQTRKLRKLNKNVAISQNQIKSLEQRLGHYSIKNVNKRDTTARKNLNLLRTVQRSERKISNQLRIAKLNIDQLNLTVKHLQTENANLTESAESVQTKLDIEVVKKTAAQKSNSKLRSKVEKLKGSMSKLGAETYNVDELMLKCNELLSKTESLTHHLSEKDVLLSELEEELEEAKRPMNIKTKQNDGSYIENVRLCVVQLVGLEVATEKVSPVIQTVSEIIFGVNFSPNELPNKTTVQTIVDEGHYLAKAYIADRIDNCESWGLNRDGTSRRKQKIIDTSVTLDTGEVASLGFTHISRETAKVIHDTTQGKLNEMANIQTEICFENEKVSDDFIIKSLTKLAYSMSDRASNEKLADKLLNEWRDQILQKCDSNTEIQSVKHFHCMAHVLLGFHKYICDDLKLLQKSIVQEHGPLGRDSLPIFKFWSKTGTVIERVVRTTSDIFGPVGDHYGLRDRWEAFCSQRGIKSHIGSYQDNRFNGVFQTSAEILIHHEEFKTVLATASAPNKKLQSVSADLESDIILTMLVVFAAIYISVTGPYWQLVTSGKVAYLELYKYVQNLKNFLEICEKKPMKMFEFNPVWCEEEYDVGLKQKIMKAINTVPTNKDILSSVMKTSCSAMIRTINKQLEDFLPGGVFCKKPSKEDLQKTAFAHVTNLACEHHFGDLDSSQKRRPNASMYHHSSVQMLKRNRLKMKRWYDNMSHDRKVELWKKARKGGKKMRVNHQTHEKRVMEDINSQMNEKPAKKRKVEKTPTEIHDKISNKLPNKNTIKEQDYVIVAYQDNWYPGLVLNISNNDELFFKVKFLAHCKKAGTFMWPVREDVQTVSHEFVIACDIVPECLNSGRQWLFKDFKKFEDLYVMYRSLFFSETE